MDRDIKESLKNVNVNTFRIKSKITASRARNDLIENIESYVLWSDISMKRNKYYIIVGDTINSESLKRNGVIIDLEIMLIV